MTGCASAPTVYQPIDGDGIGYEETRIESNRYRVLFRGGMDADRLDVERLAIKRAAELTLAYNADWFRVVYKDVWKEGDPGSSGRPSVGVGASGGSRGNVSVGVGVSLDLTPDRSRYQAMLEILTGVGEFPEDDPDIYDAQEVLAAQTSAS